MLRSPGPITRGRGRPRGSSSRRNLVSGCAQENPVASNENFEENVDVPTTPPHCRSPSPQRRSRSFPGRIENVARTSFREPIMTRSRLNAISLAEPTPGPSSQSKTVITPQPIVVAPQILPGFQNSSDPKIPDMRQNHLVPQNLGTIQDPEISQNPVTPQSQTVPQNLMVPPNFAPPQNQVDSQNFAQQIPATPYNFTAQSSVLRPQSFTGPQTFAVPQHSVAQQAFAVPQNLTAPQNAPISYYYPVPQYSMVPPSPQSSSFAPFQQNATAQPPNQSLADWRTLIRALRTPETSPPTFSGLDHEDPTIFLKECENYFSQATIEPAQWSRMVHNSLKDSASKWWEVYKNLNLPWSKFRDLLTQRFAGNTTLMRLKAKLYSSKQQERESVGVFLQQKYLLALRLQPTASEADTVALLLESLRPSLKKVLRAAPIESFSDLLDRAIQAEADESEESAPRKESRELPKIKPSSVDNQVAPAKSDSHLPPPCHHCPGRHYHRYCPVFQSKQGNWRARAEEGNVATVQSAPGAPRC